ncbi:hypothetical protein FQR65_LT08261 [Abscondita terminalis]|nr:hypothetical protein FQR65_LT08261 [Abscondita terminalis]
MNIETFVFLDSETTGLPSQQHNKTRITELCLVAVQSDHLALGVFPRVQNKINLCFNPCKFIDNEASKITGLSNDLLEYQPRFNSTSYGIMYEFLNMLRKPVCLVAHNGNGFDYPILKAEIDKTGNALPDDILCVDSLIAFRNLLSKKKNMPVIKKEVPFEFDDDFDSILVEAVGKIESDIEISSQKLSVEEIQKINETTPVKMKAECSTSPFKKKAENDLIPRQDLKKRKLFGGIQSFALAKLYPILTGKEESKAHRAEVDVSMLIECAGTLGQVFVDWYPFADANKGADDDVQDGLVHIRIQQRNGRKTLTTVQGLSSDYDLRKIVRACKKEFACNGTVIEHPEYGEVLQLQGDQRENICQWLTKAGLAKPDQLKKEEFNRLGCTNSKNVAISIQVYLELCEVKKFWDIEYLYDESIGKIYFTAKLTRKGEPSMFIPVEVSESLSFNSLQDLLKLERSQRKQVFIVIVSSDSTCVFYQISNGLVDPVQEKNYSLERSRKIDAVLRRNKDLIEQAALCNIPITLKKDSTTESTSSTPNK